MTTSPTQTDEYDGKMKCNTCGDYQRDHKMGRDYCLKDGRVFHPK